MRRAAERPRDLPEGRSLHANPGIQSETRQNGTVTRSCLWGTLHFGPLEYGVGSGAPGFV